MQIMDVLRLVRDDIADLNGHPSFSHLQMRHSSAGTPMSAVSFLLYLADAVHECMTITWLSIAAALFQAPQCLRIHCGGDISREQGGKGGFDHRGQTCTLGR
eukprot:gene28769-31951_t